MAEQISTKPYFIRALHEWCTDNGFTPHLLVGVDAQTKVPMGYVKDGEIVLNLNYAATKDLHIGNEAVTFSARFGGVSNNLYVPIDAVRGIFARENGQGMFFQAEIQSELIADQSADGKQIEAVVTDLPLVEGKSKEVKKPTLKLVK
ncbi:MAG: ClpXP protease specificity-enhancing factor [Methylophilaceae bacterium]|jgi:stringent starvation protein B|nr:ClpXP protease specificity-enhancing factor [Methyloradius sp.]